MALDLDFGRDSRGWGLRGAEGAVPGDLWVSGGLLLDQGDFVFEVLGHVEQVVVGFYRGVAVVSRWGGERRLRGEGGDFGILWEILSFEGE